MVLNMRFRFLERFLNKNTPDTPLFLYNTLGKEKQEFILSAPAKTVRMYNFGPTVYDVQHIGNLSMFVFADILRRTLEYNGLTVKQVINITDVGHLTSDADEGEDRMTKGLKREGKKLTLENMRELGERYTQIFLDDLRKLNIDTSRITFPRASDYIPAQIAMITTLQEKGYAYTTGDGVYFDTSRFPAYGALGGVNIEGQKEGARVAIKSEKRNAADFALWQLDSNPLCASGCTARTSSSRGRSSPSQKETSCTYTKSANVIFILLPCAISSSAHTIERRAISPGRR